MPTVAPTLNEPHVRYSDRIVPASELPQDQLFNLYHPDRAHIKEPTLRMTYPIVRGDEVAARLQKLSADRLNGGRWGAGIIPIVEPTHDLDFSPKTAKRGDE